MDSLTTIFASAVATLGFVAALFFLRFWARTRDVFFLLFALAFAIDASSRLILVAVQQPDESEPYYYLPRLVMFCLIILALLLKNRPSR